jgi:hypothetical protein
LQVRDFSRLLLAMEVAAAQTYWQMPPGRTGVYPPAFAANGMAGVVGGTDVSAETWFGAEPE